MAVFVAAAGAAVSMYGLDHFKVFEHELVREYALPVAAVSSALAAVFALVKAAEFEPLKRNAQLLSTFSSIEQSTPKVKTSITEFNALFATGTDDASRAQAYKQLINSYYNLVTQFCKSAVTYRRLSRITYVFW
jgi:hypothetical protein